VTPEKVTPKELVFVLDSSGSMSGFPIEKAKETMRLALGGLHAEDTFNLITFAGHTQVLFPGPVPATKHNLRKAQEFLNSRHGRGGTEMMQAIRTALAPSDSQKHVRIVCFMTDGYVGNDMAILAEMKRHPNARVFAFGIGSSVNRFLLDKMAELGRGEVEYVGLDDDGAAAAKRFHERVRSPLLTDIAVDWGQLEVHETFPRRIPDLFDAKPLVITGRYSTPGKGVVRISGKVAGRSIHRELVVDLPVTEKHHNVLGTLWARQKIAHLMTRDFGGIQRGTAKANVKQAIVRLGLEHRLLTQFTSFVAVEEQLITAGGQPRRIDVPVELPEGVSYEMLGISTGHGSQPTRYRHASRQVMHSLMPAAPLVIGSSAKQLRQSAAESADAARYGSSSATNPTNKLESALHALLEGPPQSNQAEFVKDGQVQIQVWLSDASSETLAQLKQSGFELLHHPKKGKLVIGQITIEKLEDLARLQAVRYITPLRA
jgi:Ca-activated chloride channel family protein